MSTTFYTLETTFQVLTSCRWMLSYIGCICFTLIYALRINMGIAVVCMVKAANTSTSVQKAVSEECAASSFGSNETLSSQVRAADPDQFQ